MHERVSILISGLFLILATSVEAAVTGPFAWEPSRTFALVVGTLEWRDSESLESFPNVDRRDKQLVDWLKKTGVPDDQIIYLQDKNAKLSAIDRSLDRLLQSADEGDQLIVYYCGHGYPAESDQNELMLASYDAGIGDVEGWSVDAMVSKIDDEFSGDRVAIFFDCCHSGGIQRAIKRHGKHGSYAGFGSSTATQSSTGNWTFTESLLRAVNGDPTADRNRDGVITLGELGQFIRDEMAFAEDQQSVATFDGTWSEATSVAQAKTRNDKRIGSHVTVRVDGDDWKAHVLDIQNGKIQVFYYGYEISDIEWVSPSQIQWQSR